ncbi:hypothetical protein ACSU64_27955 [Bacillaceae bacterium C204]|uniref:hypothetical protein n=1 Tax=Neobacillus sp. 204 TaxID=3383351 RepID=UPI00397B51BE
MNTQKIVEDMIKNGFTKEELENVAMRLIKASKQYGELNVSINYGTKEVTIKAVN